MFEMYKKGRIGYDQIRYHCSKELEYLGPYFRDENGKVDKIWIDRMLSYILTWYNVDFYDISVFIGRTKKCVSSYYELYEFKIQRNKDLYRTTVALMKRLNPDVVCGFPGDIVLTRNIPSAYTLFRSKIKWPKKTSENEFIDWIIDNYNYIDRYYFIHALICYFTGKGIDPEVSGFLPILKEKARRMVKLVTNYPYLSSYENQILNHFYETIKIDRNNFWEIYVTKEYLNGIIYEYVKEPDQIDRMLHTIIESYDREFNATKWLYGHLKNVKASCINIIKKHEDLMSITIAASQRSSALRIGKAVYDYIYYQPIISGNFPHIKKLYETEESI
jgi:hypothetical protein